MNKLVLTIFLFVANTLFYSLSGINHRDLTMFEKVINLIVSYLTTFIDAVIKVTSFIPDSALVGGRRSTFDLFIYLSIEL